MLRTQVARQVAREQSNTASRSIAASCADAYCTSGTSPTLHVIGAGAVARAFIDLVSAEPGAHQGLARLVAISDRGGTVYAREGLAADQVQSVHDIKASGGSVGQVAGGAVLPLEVALPLIAADIVVDCSSTEVEAASATRARVDAVLGRGATYVTARKDALLRDPCALVAGAAADRFGFSAVLAGCGHRIACDLATLQRETRELVLVPNATTTAILLGIEAGQSFDAALSTAQRLGLAETDAELDVNGVDAAIKAVIVASLVLGLEVSLDDVVLPPRLSDLSASELRARAAKGRTTRLVARARPGAPLRLAYEALPRATTFAVPTGRVVYGFEDHAGDRRLYFGARLGAAGVALALLEDVVRSRR